MAGLNSLKVLERKSTSDRISDELRQMIIEGSLPPGEQLGEAKLAEQLGVSRAPVREALQTLVQERLLVSVRNKGATVVSFNPNDIWEIYDARCAIESHAASHVISKGAEVQTQVASELRAILAQFEPVIGTGDHRRISAIDLEFHKHLVAASENSRLVDSYRKLSAEALACINRLEIAHPAGYDIVEEHEPLIDYLARGDQKLMLATLETQMSTAAERLTQAMLERSSE